MGRARQHGPFFGVFGVGDFSVTVISIASAEVLP
jgi:hypothetical protein